MIKGVNKQIIEITETGSEYFEKMLLVVKPQYSSMNVKKLKKKAGTVACGISAASPSPPPPPKKKRPFLASAAKLSAAAGAGAALTAMLIRL